MKSKFLQKNLLKTLGQIIIVVLIGILGLYLVLRPEKGVKTQTLEIKTVSSVIQADGMVVAQNQAVLHFQTGGKLVYLSGKVGDSVYQGQIIASLDKANLQANLRQAEQDYNAAQAVVQKVYNQTGRVPDLTFDQNVTQTAAEATQNKAYDNVVKSKQAIVDADLVSPLNGIITGEDVDTVNSNVTSLTSFTVSDPSSLVFRADVLETDIDFVSVGSSVSIKVGNNKTFLGTVNKIYPDKVTLANGQKVYQVDIESDAILRNGVLGQSGTALIQSNVQNKVQLVPTWTVLSSNYLWVLSNNKAVLRNVKVGKTHGDMIEILGGLKENDRVITNPEGIVADKYSIL